MFNLTKTSQSDSNGETKALLANKAKETRGMLFDKAPCKMLQSMIPWCHQQKQSVSALLRKKLEGTHAVPRTQGSLAWAEWSIVSSRARSEWHKPMSSTSREAVRFYNTAILPPKSLQKMSDVDFQLPIFSSLAQNVCKFMINVGD